MTLGKPDGKKTLEANDALNSDIISAIHRNFPRAVEQTREFAKQFRRGTKTETARAVWTFLKKAISYLKDPESEQLVRLPSRFVFDEVGDCKSYSLLAASLLYNLGFRPVKFRYANYKGGIIPSHVYVVTADENGRELIVDGVWNEFNSEKTPRYKFDKEAMKVYTLSGTDGIGKGFLKKLSIKKVATGIKKVAKKVSLKNVAKGVKKIGLAAPRRAYRTMVALNALGIAVKLEKLRRKNPSALKSKWESLGGKYSELEKSINAGIKHKGAKKKLGIKGIGSLEGFRRLDRSKRFHSMVKNNHREAYQRILNRKRLGEFEVYGIGAVPAVAAILAAAAPIIAALAPLFKSAGVDSPEYDESGNKVGESVDAIVSAASEAYRAAGGGGGGGGSELEDPTQSDKYDTEENASDEPGGFTLSTPIKIIGAAALAYLLFKPKRRAA